MSVAIINHVTEMKLAKEKTLNKFGKDATGQITYTFNQQGFRSLYNFDFVPDYAFFGCSLVFGVGVQMQQTFPYLFQNSQNYGIAGNYNNLDTFILITQFVNSSLYCNTVKIAVVWHLRDVDHLESYYHALKNYNILHFFCGRPLPYERCYSVFPNIDYDVSKTHYGPKSHRTFYKILCALFDL